MSTTAGGHDNHDFDFLDKHVDHLVDHPYDVKYYYDPVHHFIVDKYVVAVHQHLNHDHVILAAAHFDLGVEQYIE